MFDNDEIVSSFENEHQAHFLNPSIVCGLGSYGSLIIDRLERRLNSVSGLNYQDLLYLIDFSHGQSGKTLFGRKNSNRSTIELIDQYETRTSLSKTISASSSDIACHWQETLSMLLDRVSGHSAVDSNKVNLLFIGDTKELDASVGGLDIPEIIRSATVNYVANLNFDITGLFMLPKGASDKGAEVFAFLQELGAHQNDISSPPGTPLYDHCFLVSPANTSGVLDDDASIDLITEFLMLTLTDSRIAIDDLFRHDEGSLATFGLSSLVYPADEVAEIESKSFAAGLIDEEILGRSDIENERRAKRFLKENELDLEGIKGHLMKYEGGSIADQTRLDPLYFSEVDMKYWPDRIASYDSYLENEKTAEIIKALDNNLLKTFSEARAVIRKKVDDMMTTDSGLDGTAQFLKEIKKQLSDIHVRSIRLQDEAIKPPPDLDKYHRSLSNNIKNLSSPAALFSRLVVLGTLLYFATSASMLLLRRVPEAYFDTGFIPAGSVAGSIVAAGVIALGWMTYRRQERKLFGLRTGYLRRVEERHKYIIEWLTLRDVSWLFAGAKEDALVERHITSLIGILEEEMRAVDNLKKSYLWVFEQLKNGETNYPGSKIRRSVLDAFGVKLEILYKRGNYRMAEEAKEFVSLGGHRDWRGIKKKELMSRIVVFAAKGFDYSRISGVQQVIAELDTESKNFEKVLSDLKKFSAPCLATTSTVPKSIEFLATASPSNVSWLGGRELSSASLIRSVDRNSICYLQVAAIDIGSIASLKSWRSDYDLLIDKSGLHRFIEDDTRSDGMLDAGGGA